MKTENIFIGSLYRLENVKEIYLDQFPNLYLTVLLSRKKVMAELKFEGESLFYKKEECYIDIKTGKKYKRDSNKEDEVIVRDLIPLNRKYEIKVKNMTKRKILKLYDK